MEAREALCRLAAWPKSSRQPGAAWHHDGGGEM